MPELYDHPFSSNSQKVLTALYDYKLDFDFKMLSSDQPTSRPTRWRWRRSGRFALADCSAAPQHFLMRTGLTLSTIVFRT